MSLGLLILVVLAVQEEFLVPFRSIRRLSGDASLSTWLTTLNTALMHLHSRDKRAEEASTNSCPISTSGLGGWTSRHWGNQRNPVIEMKQTRALLHRHRTTSGCQLVLLSQEIAPVPGTSCTPLLFKGLPPSSPAWTSLGRRKSQRK